MPTYIMSDIHGCYDQYQELLHKLEFDAEDELFILGDALHRGSEPIKVLLDLMNRENVTFVMGNHDATALMVLRQLAKEIVTLFEELIKDAEQFFVDAEKHIDCWDETKDDKSRKEELRCTAYEKRLAFFEKWKSSSTKCLEYIQSKELV